MQCIPGAHENAITNLPMDDSIPATLAVRVSWLADEGSGWQIQ